MRTALLPSFLLIFSLGSANTQAVVIGEVATPEERCADFKDNTRDFDECVKNAKEEQAGHDKFLRDSENDDRKRVEAEALRRGKARAAYERNGMKLGTVHIGMTAQVVKDCGWGDPVSVNRTITAKRRTEQLVYPGGAYLYIEGGRLIAIQD